jgi:hypothetical protein
MIKLKISENSRNLGLMLLVMILPILFLYAPPSDPDFGWHYIYGQKMFDSAQIIRTNIFSYTMPDYQWANSYWLSEILLYWTHANLGHALAGIFTALVMGVLLVVITKNWLPMTVEKISLIILFLVSLSVTTSAVRPFFFSTLLLMLLIYVLMHEEKSIIFLPFIFLIWTNIHADFVLGLFVFSLYAFEKGVGFWKSGKVGGSLKLATLVLLCYLATLINPFGIHLWTTLLGELTMFTRTVVVLEWAPFSAFAPGTFALIAIYIIVFGAALLSVRSKMKPWHFTATLVFAILSIRAAYMTRIFSILLFPLMPEAYTILKSYLSKRTELVSLLIHSFFFLALMAGLGRFNNLFMSSYDTRLWAEGSAYPYDAVNYIKSAKLQGNMFNSYDWGGYLIWQLPSYKTFIDGRMTSWRQNGVNIFNDYVSIERADNPELLWKYFNTFNVQFVLDKPDAPLVKYLTTEAQDKWQKVYSDKVSVVLTRP